VVGADNKVHLQAVKLGSQVGTNWLVEAGLKGGDRVVVEGTQKVKEGTLVSPKLIEARESPAPSAIAAD